MLECPRARACIRTPHSTAGFPRLVFAGVVHFAALHQQANDTAGNLTFYMESEPIHRLFFQSHENIFVHLHHVRERN